MSAQTIEAITDMDTIGGQSMVGKMREERNQARLQELGVPLDNNIDNAMSPVDQRTVLANGTVSGALPESGIESPNGEIYTIPSWPTNEEGGAEIEPIPAGFYLPAEVAFNNPDVYDQNDIATGEQTVGFQPTDETQPGDIDTILNGDPNPIANPLIPAGPVIMIASPIDDIVIMEPPAEYNISNLPSNLDPNYTSSTMMPSTLSIPKAIDHVIACNCDCWIN